MAYNPNELERLRKLLQATAPQQPLMPNMPGSAASSQIMNFSLDAQRAADNIHLPQGDANNAMMTMLNAPKPKGITGPGGSLPASSTINAAPRAGGLPVQPQAPIPVAPAPSASLSSSAPMDMAEAQRRYDIARAEERRANAKANADIATWRANPHDPQAQAAAAKSLGLEPPPTDPQAQKEWAAKSKAQLDQIKILNQAAELRDKSAAMQPVAQPPVPVQQTTQPPPNGPPAAPQAAIPTWDAYERYQQTSANVGARSDALATQIANYKAETERIINVSRELGKIPSEEYNRTATEVLNDNPSLRAGTQEFHDATLNLYRQNQAARQAGYPSAWVKYLRETYYEKPSGVFSDAGAESLAENQQRQANWLAGRSGPRGEPVPDRFKTGSLQVPTDRMDENYGAAFTASGAPAIRPAAKDESKMTSDELRAYRLTEKPALPGSKMWMMRKDAERKALKILKKENPGATNIELRTQAKELGNEMLLSQVGGADTTRLTQGIVQLVHRKDFPIEVGIKKLEEGRQKGIKHQAVEDYAYALDHGFSQDTAARFALGRPPKGKVKRDNELQRRKWEIARWEYTQVHTKVAPAQNRFREAQIKFQEYEAEDAGKKPQLKNPETLAEKKAKMDAAFIEVRALEDKEGRLELTYEQAKREYLDSLVTDGERPAVAGDVPTGTTSDEPKAATTQKEALKPAATPTATTPQQTPAPSVQPGALQVIMTRISNGEDAATVLAQYDKDALNPDEKATLRAWLTTPQPRRQ